MHACTNTHAHMRANMHTPARTHTHTGAILSFSGSTVPVPAPPLMLHSARDWQPWTVEGAASL